MALLFIDGFDHYDPQMLVDGAPALSRGKAAYLSPIAVRTAGRRFNSYALDLNNDRWGHGEHGGYALRLSETRSALICGCAVLIDSGTPVDDDSVMGVIDDTAAVEHYVVLDRAAGVVRAYALLSGTSSPVLLGVSGPVSIPVTWIYVELKVVQGSTSGEVHVRVNGAPVLVVAGIDTVRGGGPLRTVYLGTAGNRLLRTFISVDDFYLADTSGDMNNDFLGDVRVDTLRPTGPGLHGDWQKTPDTSEAWQTLCDGDDATGIYTLEAYRRHSVAIEQLPVMPRPVIHGVQVTVLAQRNDEDPRLRGLVVSGGHTLVSTDRSLEYDLQWRTALFERDPSGGVPWTEASVNAAEFGVESAP